MGISWHAKIDDFIKSAQISNATEEFSKINARTLTRAELTPYANLARRLGKSNEAIRVLRQFVRPKAKVPMEATSEEKLEYAMALIKLGALNEGIKLVETVDGKQFPDRYLFASFAHISEWQYQEASVLIEKYIEHPEVTEYSVLVAKVNLLSCYIFTGNYDKAETLIQNLLSHTDNDVVTKARRTIFLSAAQLHILRKDFNNAQKNIDAAFALMSTQNSIDSVVLQKWNWILNVNKFGPLKKYLDELKTIRANARNFSSPEALRDIDYQQGLYFSDTKILNHVYFGTPFLSFKEKIKKSYQRIHNTPFEPSEEYVWDLSQDIGEKNEVNFLNVQDGANSFSSHQLRPGSSCQRFLQILARDFYRPLSTYQVHNLLFEESFYNPNSTPKKIHQASYRLNQWLEEANIPATVFMKKSFFYIEQTQKFSLIIDNKPRSDPRVIEFCESLFVEFAENWFSSTDASRKLNLPRRTMTLNLKLAADEGLLIKMGAGPTTRFCVKPSS